MNLFYVKYGVLIRCPPLLDTGTQFKMIVEYAPLQRVPKLCTKKDGREGTIFKGTKMIIFCGLRATFMPSFPDLWSQLFLLMNFRSRLYGIP